MGQQMGTCGVGWGGAANEHVWGGAANEHVWGGVGFHVVA